LSAKKAANLDVTEATEEGFGREGVGDLCRIVLTVFQSWRGFDRLEEIRLEL